MELAIWIDNRGTCPADNVEVTLELPDRFALIKNKEEVEQYINDRAPGRDPYIDGLFVDPREPTRPEPPKPRDPQIYAFSEHSKHLQEIIASNRLMPPTSFDMALEAVNGAYVNSFDGLKVEGNEVKLWTRSARHKKPEVLGTILAIFRGDAIEGNFSLPYRIWADNHPEITEGRLLIRPHIEQMTELEDEAHG